MLYWRRAAQREKTRCKRRSFHDFSPFPPSPLAAPAAGVALAAGGGSSSEQRRSRTTSPSSATRRSAGEFNALLEPTKNSYKQQKRSFPKPARRSTPRCRTRSMQYLVQRAEFEQKAEELDVKVTDPTSTSSSRRSNRSTSARAEVRATSEKKYKAQIATQGLTEEQVETTSARSCSQNKLLRKVTDGREGPRQRDRRLLQEAQAAVHTSPRAATSGTSSSRRRRWPTRSSSSSRTAATSRRSRRSTRQDPARRRPAAS